MTASESIFISYRREDSSGHAGRLRDHLQRRFGARIFHDVNSIPDGEVFENILERAFSTCQVAVIIIGKTWLTCADEQGHPRLDDPEDWVRTETRMLLSRDIRVIPVLVGGATMPRAVDLPEDLHLLVKRQSRELRDTAWESDVRALMDRLSEIIGPGSDARSAEIPARKNHTPVVAWIATAIASGLVVTFLIREVGWDRSSPSAVSETQASAPSPPQDGNAQPQAQALPVSPGSNQPQSPSSSNRSIANPAPKSPSQASPIPRSYPPLQPSATPIQPPQRAVQRDPFLNLEFEIPAGWSRYEQESYGLGRRLVYLVPPGEPRPRESDEVERVAIVITNDRKVDLVGDPALRERYQSDYLRFLQSCPACVRVR